MSMRHSVISNVINAVTGSFVKYPVQRLARMMATTASANIEACSNYPFETLKVTQPHEYVLHVEMNRPEKRNAMNRIFWQEIRECFRQISSDADCRSVVLSGAGAVFSSGIDLMDCAGLLMGDGSTIDVSRRGFELRKCIEQFQQSFTAIEECPKPVVAAIHSACIGAGVDMICACDMRYCTHDAWFQIKEVDIGLAADVGTLQRMPKIVGNDSLVRELAYTSRKLLSDEASKCGLVSRCFPDKESLINACLETALVIASKSPVAVQGTKVNLVYARDHTVKEALHHMVLSHSSKIFMENLIYSIPSDGVTLHNVVNVLQNIWNQCMLQSEDLVKSATAQMEKSTPTYSKL